jgi:hypothetical protein
MTYWYVLDCPPHEEIETAQSLEAYQIAAYVPMVLKTFGSGRNAPHKYGIEVPLLPSLLFIDKLHTAIIGCVWCDRYGKPIGIPEWQLNQFRSIVEGYLKACRDSVSKGKKPPLKPRSLVFKLGDTGAKEAAMQILFGNEKEKAA